MTENAGEDKSGAALGATLREAREASGRELRDVAKALHLEVGAIAAIEDGRFAELPMRPYTRGYIRNYARLLGLDADDLVQRFDATDTPSAAPGTKAQRHGLAAAPEELAGSHAWRYTAIVVVLIAALGGVLWMAWGTQEWQLPFFDDPAPAPEETVPEAASASPPGPPDVSPWPTVADDAFEDVVDEGLVVAEATVDEQPEPPTVAEDVDFAVPAEPGDEAEPDDPAEPGGEAEADDVAGVPDPAELPEPADPATAVDGTSPGSDEPPAAGVGILTLTFDEDSWVTVDDATGERLFGDLGQVGESFTVAGPVPMSVLVGNAAGVRVEFDGEAFDLEPYVSQNVARFMLGG